VSQACAELRDGASEAYAETRDVDAEDERFAYHSFGAVFAEVSVDPELHRVCARRLTGVFDAGRVMNATTARNQLCGGLVFGLGMALLEELTPDPAHGRFINADLGGYLVPVHADVPPLDVSFIDEPDLAFNSLGCRGMGELAVPGTAAAIANAVYNATGKRIRSLPITVEKLMR
jgi:xanthine dehydrogenase YagR molybdenum-binding subunit